MSSLLTCAVAVALPLALLACGDEDAAGSGGAGATASSVSAGGGGGGGESLPAARAEHYYGSVSVTSPDGQTVYDAHHTLIRRDVSPQEGRIVESIYQDSEPTLIAHYVTTLVQQGATPVFDVSDDAMTYSGTVTYLGDDVWDPSGWSYDITFDDGSGTLTGTAEVGPDGGFDTAKVFTDGAGAAVATIAEHVTPIDEATFEAQKTAALPWPDSL